MTNQFLTLIVRKNRMCFEWKTTPETSADHEHIKLRFKFMKKICGMQYRNDFNRMFTAYKCDIKKHN